MIYVQYLYICDICRHLVINGFEHIIGNAPLDPGISPQEENWQQAGFKHLCPNHIVTIDAKVDGKAV